MTGPREKPLVLLVDDDHFDLVLLRSLLATSYDLILASDGEQAIREARQQRPDLILLDIQMPDMDGFEVCRRLKGEARLEKIPIIFLTGLLESSSEAKGFAMGAEDYITKPFVLSVVLTRIKHVLDRRHTLESLYEQNNFLAQQFVERTQALQQLNDQLHRAHQEQELMRKNLFTNEKMALLGSLVAGFTHEINTPIGVCKGTLSHVPIVLDQLESLLSNEEVDEEELNQSLGALRKNIELGLKNLETALDVITRFKRTSVDQSSEQSRRFQLRDVVTDVITSLRSVFKRTNIVIENHIDIGLNIYSQPGLLGQLLTNLLMNSFKHGFDQGKRAGQIHIDARLEAGHLHFQYSDTGQGMRSEILERIYEPYFTMARDTDGSGLGMYIVHGIVQSQLGGSIHCQSAPGQGVVFLIEFPVSEAHSG
ncbi:MAG: hybrid sensor histidine kinase/response regulator [Magnetococcus sp. DMHC-6]